MPTDPLFSLRGRRVWVAGHRGMVGAAIVRRLAEEDCKILTVDRAALDLRRQAETEAWMADAKPEVVFLAAARVGGILANDSYPADFLYENLALQTNIIHAAFKNGVRKLLFLGSSCIYPKFAPQPIKEDALLAGPLEPTNEWYAIAKIAGLKLCQAYRRQRGCDYISAMPSNLYGPGDNFDLNSSHVVPALMRKAHEAKLAGADAIEVWGTGEPRREFLHVNDCADAIVFLMKHYSAESHVNVGSGQDITIRDLAELVMKVVGFEGTLRFDTTKPDGTSRKLMSAGLLQAAGWRPRLDLAEGLNSTYEWFLANQARLRVSA